MSSIPKVKKGNYAWVVVATGFLMWSVAFGVQYSFGIFIKPLQEALNWSRATTSWAMTIHLVVYALGMIPAGWAVDHINTKVLYSAAALVIGSSIALCSFVTQPWQLYLLYGLPLGLGISICGPVVMAIITRWFSKGRGLALGITSAGVGFGTLAGAPLSEFLISSYGWRDAFVIIGAGSFVILLVCAFFMRVAPPPDVESMPAVAAPRKKEAPRISPSRGLSFAEAIRTKEILLIVVAQGFVGFTLRMVMVHIAPHAIDIGISSSVAALATGTIGGVSIIGRVGMGFVQDRIGARRSLMICLITQAVSMLFLPFIKSDSLFFAFAVVFGFTYGGDVPQVPAITAQLFGVAAISTIYGLVQAVGNLGGAFGPILAASIFDRVGNYTGVFLGAVAGLGVAIYCFARLRLQKSGTSSARSPTLH